MISKSKNFRKLGANFFLPGLLFFVFLTINCQRQNSTAESFSESDIVKAVVKYINYNLSGDSRLNGVYTIILESTRALDGFYYGYDASPDTLLSGNSGLDFSDYILENNNKNLVIYLTLNEPSPEKQVSVISPVYIPFADGVFPEYRADRFTSRPVLVSARSIKSYDSVNNEYQGTPNLNWVVQYDAQGFPQQWDQTCVNASSGQLSTGCDFGLTNSGENLNVAQKTVTFGIDPRSYTDYYVTGYLFRDVSSNKLAQLKVSRSGSEDNHTFVSVCYAPDGTTLSTGYCDLSDTTVNSAAKTVETFVLSDSNSTVGGKQLQKIKKYYTTSDIEFYRLTKTYSYLSERTYQVTGYTESKYTVDSSGTVTVVKSNRSTYTNSFLSETKSDMYSAGTLTSSITYQYQRDAQGRIIDYLVKDADGNSVLHADYTFDSDGWLSRKRSYDFSGTIQNETPICGENFDYSYSKDIYGNMSKTVTNYCDGNTYQTVPHEILTKIYNIKGLLTSDKKYDISGTTAYISYRVDYEYDDQGFNTKIQYYEGVGSAMQAASYKTRERDDFLYLTTEKIYNSSGELITNSSDATSDCQADSSCYSVITYTYE